MDFDDDIPYHAPSEFVWRSRAERETRRRRDSVHPGPRIDLLRELEEQDRNLSKRKGRHNHNWARTSKGVVCAICGAYKR